MTSSSVQNNITLSKPEDWDTWMVIVNSIARKTRIEAMIDPSSNVLSLQPVMSAVPRYSDIKPGAMTLQDLSAVEQEDHRLRCERYYKLDLVEYRKKKNTLKSILHFILNFISKDLLLYVEDKRTVYNMLVALKQGVAFTDKIKEIEISKQGQSLQKTSKNQQIDKGLEQGELIYTAAKRLNVSEISGDRPLDTFLTVVKIIDPSFAVVRQTLIDQNKQRDEQRTIFFQLIEDYGNIVHIDSAIFSKPIIHNAFGTFHEKKEKKFGLCIYETETHCFSECFYLNKHLRSKRWSANTEIDKKIKNKLAENEYLKKMMMKI